MADSLHPAEHSAVSQGRPVRPDSDQLMPAAQSPGSNPASSKPCVRLVLRSVPDLAGPLHPDPLVHRLLAARGVEVPGELDFPLADLPRPDSLPEIDKGVARLLAARDQGEKVLVIGDYDCDGATSTAVAMLGLRMLGFVNLDFLIPSRFDFGYGLSPAIVELAHEQYQPDLILTVDNGVASVDGVQRASELGIDVVVTDHHLAPDVLPAAVAIINPTLPGSTFPSMHLAGVGVIFYTLLALRRALADRGSTVGSTAGSTGGGGTGRSTGVNSGVNSGGSARLADLLDLVAIGTVADVVPLDRVNRTLVEQGLRRIRATRTRPGVLALLSVADRPAEALSTQDIGFGIGPRLNAAGRLDDMSIGVRCLLTENPGEADALAATLNDFNQKRRSIEQSMRASADSRLREVELSSLLGQDTFSVCLLDEHWHEGVIGILAGRIKERLHRPCLVFTGNDELTLKGSARSIKGVHIRDVLQAIAVRHPGMIEKFGGHAMAAGLTLRRDGFETFRQALEQTVAGAMGGRLAEREFLVDGSLSAAERSLSNASLLARLMPWGQGFEAPLFTDIFTVIAARVVGTGHLKLSLAGSEDEHDLDAIAFDCEVAPAHGDCIRIIYSLEVNTWRERQRLQLRVHHLEPVGLR